jgi:hypothetical protein
VRTSTTPRPGHSSRRTARRVGALTVAALAVLAACGDDADDDASDGSDVTTDATSDAPTDTSVDGPTASVPTDPATSDPATSDPTGGGTTGEASAEACDAYVAVSEQLAIGDPDAMGAALDEMSATIPEQWAGEAATVVDGFTAGLGGDPTAMQDPVFVSALGYVGGYFVDNCDLDTKLEVTGEDYTFTGMPTEIAAGRVGLRLVNVSAGSEPHELVILRRPDGDERTVADIAALDPETLFTDYEMVGVAFAEVPAAMMSIVLDVEPGEYVAICNLPVADDETSTHAHEGMVVAFTAA